jgi:ribosomal protein L44E
MTTETTTTYKLECCVCGRTKTEKGWEKVHTPADEIRSHGYCPACFEDTMREIARMQAEGAVA